MICRSSYYRVALSMLLGIGLFSCTSVGSIQKRIDLLNQQDISNERWVSIDFQKGFHHDTVTLKLNGVLIFNNIILSTQRITEFTSLRVNTYFFKKHQVAISYFGKDDNGDDFVSKTEIIKMDTSQVELDIIINRTSFHQEINLIKGKYLGINKKVDGELSVEQRNRQFFYD